MATKEELQKFYDDCERFDWTYEFSDDGRVWRAGEAEKQRLLAQAPPGSEKRAIFDAWSAHVFSGEAWNTPKAPQPVRP